VIAVDTNILVYAHRAETIFHESAARCMRQLCEGQSPWAIPAACLSEFLATVTHPNKFKPASELSAAFAQINLWLDAPSARVLHSGVHHWQILSELARAAKLQGGQFHDARVAALCIENGVGVIYTSDRDFGRFKALKTFNPLID
jgi:uncharacterized protein